MNIICNPHQLVEAALFYSSIDYGHVQCCVYYVSTSMCLPNKVCSYVSHTFWPRCSDAFVGLLFLFYQGNLVVYVQYIILTLQFYSICMNAYFSQTKVHQQSCYDPVSASNGSEVKIFQQRH